MRDSELKFLDFLKKNNLEYNGELLFGRIVKYRTNDSGSHNKETPSEWYRAFLNEDGSVWAKCGSHRPPQEKFEFLSKNQDLLTEKEREEIIARKKIIHAELEKEKKERESLGEASAVKLWKESVVIDDTFEFEWLQKKKLPPKYLKYNKEQDCLIVPINDMDGNLKSIQRIFRDGIKKNIYGAPMNGNSLVFGDLKAEKRIIFAEGWSTAYSIFLATGECVICCYGCKNITLVASLIKDENPSKILALAQDQGAAGERAAKDWNLVIKGEVFVPSELDFNDVYVKHGLEKVAEELKGKEINAFSINEILEMDVEEPVWIIENLFQSGSINIVSAPGGAGKTFWTTAVTMHIALGKPIFKRKTLKSDVLYIDGELGTPLLKKRLRIYKETFKEIPDNISFVPYDLTDFQISICDPCSQKKLDKLVEKYDVIVLDNWFAMSRTVENDKQMIVWKEAYRWLQRWKCKGKCFILLHHEMKGGGMGGCSQMAFDTCTNLSAKKNPNYQPYFSLQFEFNKGRDVEPQFQEPFQCDLIDGKWQLNKPQPKKR